jgi:hypothetical protein
MKKKIYLPKSLEELKKFNHKKQAELWARYVKYPYQKQLKGLWYYISCENHNLKIASKHLTKIKKYAKNPDDCLVKVYKNKYRLSPGTEIIKNFRGLEFKVTVVDENNFLWRDKNYRTLSAVAKEICGIKVSGPDFFGLNNKSIKGARHVQD